MIGGAALGGRHDSPSSPSLRSTCCATLRGPHGGLHWDHAGITVLTGGGEQRRRIVAPDPASRLDLVLVEFTAALDEQRAPSVSLSDNLRTLDVVLAMIRSSEERRRVPLPSPPDGV